jgi:L,D-transpeptidase ErfK/SrfK
VTVELHGDRHPGLAARALLPAGALVVAAGALLLGGCALLGSHPIPAPTAAAAPPPAPPAAPVLAAPVDTHKFVLNDPDDDVVGTVQITFASKSDTLLDIARRFNVGYDEIERANPGVDIWLPGAGPRVVVPTQFVLPAAARQGIVIDVAALRLYYFPPHRPGTPLVVYTHPIGIGKDGWNTPEGATKVVARVRDPVWRPSEALRRDHFNDNGEMVPAVVPAGPDNPLGKFEFKLGWPSYLIHGTNKPYGIGLRSSHGCVRLYPEDIEKLFAMVPIGTPVRVVNQPFLFGWHDHRLYLEAFGALDDDHRDWKHAQQTLLTRMLSQRMRTALKRTGAQIDWQRVAALMAAPRGVPVPVTGESASGGLDAVLAAAPKVQNRIPDGANWNGIDDTSSAPGDVEPAAQKPAPPPKPAATALNGAPGVPADRSGATRNLDN